MLLLDSIFAISPIKAFLALVASLIFIVLFVPFFEGPFNPVFIIGGAIWCGSAVILVLHLARFTLKLGIKISRLVLGRLE